MSAPAGGTRAQGPESSKEASRNPFRMASGFGPAGEGQSGKLDGEQQPSLNSRED
jgi:hypothetical protein